MISGPVFPRTRAGLFDLIARHLDQVERGLVVLASDLELDEECTVEALARDAAGRPVFVFTVDPQGDRDLPARIARAKAWLMSGLPLLARVRPLPGIDYGLPMRIIAVGFEVAPSTLDQLGVLLPGLVEVYQLRPFRIDGESVVGVHSLMGAGETGREDSFRVPTGVSDPRARTLGTRFIDLIERLEPQLRVDGDRYSRRFSHRGAAFAELSFELGALSVRVAPPAEPPDAEGFEAEATDWQSHGLSSRQDCVRAVDHVARRYLELDAAPAGVAVAEVASSVAVALPELERVNSLDGRLPLQPLRRAMAGARELSDEEFSLLGEPLEEDG